MADMLYAANAVNLNVVDHLACVTSQLNVSTAQVITLQTQINVHNGRKRRKAQNKMWKQHIISWCSWTYEQFYTGQTYASAVQPSTSSKSTQTDDKSTQTDDNITEYKKNKQ